MKTIHTGRSVLLAVLFLFTVQAHSQVPVNDSVLTKIFQSDVLLPMLIDSAIKVSPTVRRSERQIDMLAENAKATKREYLKGISFVSSYNYGNAADLSLTKEATSASQYNTFRNSKSDRFNVGVYFQIPLTSLLNRKNDIKANELQVKMAEAERDDHTIYLENEVIRLYQDMKLNHKLVLSSSKNMQSQLVNYKMVEKEFLQGNLNLESLSRLYDMYNKAVIENDSYINRFQTSFLQLQVLIGTSLTDLINKVK